MSGIKRNVCVCIGHYQSWETVKANNFHGPIRVSCSPCSSGDRSDDQSRDFSGHFLGIWTPVGTLVQVFYSVEIVLYVVVLQFYANITENRLFVWANLYNFICSVVKFISILSIVIITI